MLEVCFYRSNGGGGNSGKVIIRPSKSFKPPFCPPPPVTNDNKLSQQTLTLTANILRLIGSIKSGSSVFDWINEEEEGEKIEVLAS